MAMDNISYSQRFQIGDRLVLELNTDEIFEGDYFGGGKDFIDLTNTRQHNNPNKLKGTFSFNRKEIENIRLLKGKVTQKLPQMVVVTETEVHKHIKIEEQEYDRLKEMSNNYVFLEHADNVYFEAVKKLSEAETIGVVCLGLEDRTASIRLLVLSTWQQVYIFDMANFRNNYFYPELKEIFESHYICKVIHKGGPLLDKLYTKYKVFVRNVFDTQVVDLIIEKNKTGCSSEKARDISECLVHYFNFPQSLLKAALATSEKKWLERPLTLKRKLFAAQLVTYLIVLKDEMQKLLLSDVYRAIENVHDYYGTLNSREFSEHTYSDKVTKDLDDLIPLMNRQQVSTSTTSTDGTNST